MKKVFTRGKNVLPVILSATIICAICFFYGVVYAGEPGTDEDPIVSQSYVDGSIDALKKEVSSLKVQVDALRKTNTDLENRLESVENIKVAPGDGFLAIEVKYNEQVICGASTELVLRSGKARAIVSEAGGIVDLSSETGKDIAMNQQIPLNHLLLIPRDDGRGIKITSKNAWILIKGSYEIK